MHVDGIAKTDANELHSDAYICGLCSQSYSSIVSVSVIKSQITNQFHHQAVSVKTLRCQNRLHNNTHKYVFLLSSDVLLFYPEKYSQKLPRLLTPDNEFQ